MVYVCRGFYPFHLRVFHVKIVVALWLIYCCLVSFIVLGILFVEPILAHKEVMSFLDLLFLVVFTNKVVSELGCLGFFFLCAKMDDDMIKLNSSNYSTWKRMMEDLLYCKDLYKHIQLKEKPSHTLDDDWDVEHRKAIAYMRRWMDSTLHEHIFDETKADVVWKKLENLFVKKKKSGNKTTLIRRLINLKYKDGNSMVERISSFQRIVNKLVAMKMNIDDEMQASLLLSSFPDSCETLVVTVSNSTPIEILTMKSVKDNFLNEETRRKEKGESSSRVLVHENKKDKKNQKGVGEVKAEILMVLEEDPNLENISNVIIATRLVT